MKAKVLISVLLILLLSGASYWYFEVKRQKAKIEHLLPETSLLVVHGNNLSSTLGAINKLSWFETAKSVPFINRLNHWANKVDSLESSGKLKSSVTQLPFWISFHSTGSSDITPLYIIEAKGFKWNAESIVTILESITDESFSTEIQLFNGFNLLNVRGSQEDLVMLMQGDFLAISKENLLVEDVVRAVENESSRLVNTLPYSPVYAGDMQLILNNDRINELHQVFFSEGLKQDNTLGTVAILDLRFDENGIRAQGSTSGDEGLIGSETTIFGKSLIPVTSTAFQWRPIEIGISDFQELLKGELLSISLDMNFTDISEVLLINTADTLYLRRELSRLSEARTNPEDSTVYSESYLNTTLGYIQQSDFVEKLTSGSEKMGEPYYAIFQNTLILSDNLDALKTVMNEFDNESTWGKSVELRDVLDEMVQETDLTLVKEFNYGSESLMESLKPGWRQFFNDNPGLKVLIKRMKLQLNSSNNSYLVSSSIDFNKTRPTMVVPANAEDQPGLLEVKANIFADTSLITKPIVVRNHINSNLEVIFQDSGNSLYLASRQGEILWKKAIDGRILGGIHQVDYYNNKKLQYLFFTDSYAHLVDRNGEDVEGFPKAYQTPMAIDGAVVIDYDNSKRYRYLVKDRRGSLTMFDKEVGPLEGWNPNELGSELLHTPFHVRVRGRDAFVAVERTGKMSLLNRRGELYEGFPVNSDLRFKGDVTLLKGPNFAGTTVALMDQEGKLLEVNFEGKIGQEKQFFRPTTRSIYSMVADVLETGYRVLRNDQNRVAFYDMDGEVVFEIPLDNSGEVEAEFYNFRNGRELYTIRDVKTNQLYLFNNKGEQICPVIPASQRISILYYQNLSEYEVFVNFANQLNIYAINAQ